MKMSVDKLVSNFLVSLPARQKEILEGRYGLKNGREMTLAALGNRYGVTRERIRQIQNLSLDELRAKAKENGLAEFATLASTHLTSVGGLRRDDMLVQDMAQLAEDRGDKNTFANRVRFMLEAGKVAQFRPADKEYFQLWYQDEAAVKRATLFVSTLIKALAAKKEAVLAEKKFDEFFTQTSKMQNLTGLVGTNFMAASKRFSTNHYGDAGLTEWPEINPRTSRDFAYLVLKKEAKPLHFTAIAEYINKVRKNKKTNHQTVHNELIKDDRFVLVGRGTYGLAEFGLMAGTAREVMSEFIKKHGPLKAKDLVQLVLAKRVFKENTLLLNLQNKTHFKRMEDGRYTLREV